MRLSLGFLLFAVLCASGHADIVNGGFETGDLTGWATGGTDLNGVQVLASGQLAASDSSMSIAAPSGTYYALVSNGPGDQGGTPLDTTTLTSSLYTVAAGDLLSFQTDFFTNEPSTANGGNPDFFQVSILDGATQTVIASGNVDGAQTTFSTVDCNSVFLAAPDGTTLCSHSGLQTTSVDLSSYAGQNVQFQFLVSDAVDNSFDSALLVDNVQVSANAAVPEPRTQTLLLLAVMFLGLGVPKWWRSAGLGARFRPASTVPPQRTR